ncbi:MAG: hypothetical protein ACPIOQ_66580 [Promethearchaeia archaeon]
MPFSLALALALSPRAPDILSEEPYPVSHRGRVRCLCCHGETENSGIGAKKFESLVLVAAVSRSPRYWEVEVGGYKQQKGGEGRPSALMLLQSAADQEASLSDGCITNGKEQKARPNGVNLKRR